MENPHATVEHIEKWLDYIENNQHDRLISIVESLDEEITAINRNNKKRELPLLNDLTSSYGEVKKEVLDAIKKEQTEIFPKIRNAVANIQSESAEHAYRDLSTPVRQVIMDHHRILDKIHALLPIVTGLGYNGLTKDEHLKMYMDLFDFYNSYDKLVYMEENMIFPAIVAAFEKKEEWYG